MRNIEIKAKVRDLKYLLAKAETLSDTPMELIQQCDTFFHCTNGRLKLRKFEDESSELIYYARDDKEGPKLSSYDKVSIPASSTINLKSVLKLALGEKGIVKKERQLFMCGQTRIHVDSVEGLGDFMELEVKLKDHEKPEDGMKIAHSLMEQLGIDKNDLIAGAYTDLLEKNSNDNK